MILTAAIVAGMAGGLAALIARAFADPKHDKNRYLVAMVISFAVLFAIGKMVVVPHVQLRAAEAELQKVPAFQALKKHDAVTYQEIKADLKKLIKEGGKKQDLIITMRDRVIEIVKERLPEASDESVVDYIDATMVELDELYERGDDSCHKFLFPKEGEFLDPEKYFSKETIQADLEALARVIESSATDPQEIPDQAEVMPWMQPVLLGMVADYGPDVALMQNPHAFGVNKRRVCEMAATLYDKILELPTERAGKLLRFMLSESM